MSSGKQLQLTQSWYQTPREEKQTGLYQIKVNIASHMEIELLQSGRRHTECLKIREEFLQSAMVWGPGHLLLLVVVGLQYLIQTEHSIHQDMLELPSADQLWCWPSLPAAPSVLLVIFLLCSPEPVPVFLICKIRVVAFTLWTLNPGLSWHHKPKLLVNNLKHKAWHFRALMSSLYFCSEENAKNKESPLWLVCVFACVTDLKNKPCCVICSALIYFFKHPNKASSAD